MTRKHLLGYLQDSAAVESVTIDGSTYEVRGLTLTQVRDLTRRSRKGDEIEIDRYQALMLVASVYDDKGERVFDDADLDLMRRLRGALRAICREGASEPSGRMCQASPRRRTGARPGSWNFSTSSNRSA